MSTILFDADAGVTELGVKRRASTTVAEASDAYAAQIIDDYLAARNEGRIDVMQLVRDHAQAVDPDLVVELDGFDYPAAA
ncbi:hypothetical protein [Streptomyces sp.]|uniref:hypothetical protein n=1 Tax=Streptomyces sp. TaxID=1931 RepID=UPI002810E6E6|nr:hypothetical protein [Streptomyces sp.]